MSTLGYAQFIPSTPRETEDYALGEKLVTAGIIYYSVSAATIGTGIFLVSQEPVTKIKTVLDDKGNVVEEIEETVYVKNAIGCALICTGIISALIGTTKIRAGEYMIKKAKLDFVVRNGLAVVISF